MDKHTNEGLNALIYLQEHVGVNFAITFLKTTGEWQFAIPTKNAVKIRNRSFDDLISSAEKCMAEAFRAKHGGDYKDALDKDQQISKLQWAVDVLTKENKRLITKYTGTVTTNFIKKDCETAATPKESTTTEKEGKYAKLKRRIHKELFKRFRGVTMSSPHNWVSSSDITIQNIEDIDKWQELDPSDYKREYTNARQRLYWAKQQKRKGKKVGSSKKKDKVVRERKYGITDDLIKEEMKRDYENPWKAYKNKNWKKAFKRAKLRLYARNWNAKKN